MPIVRLGLRFLLVALFRVRVSGLENLPTGPAAYVIAGAPHRNWVEPLLLHAHLAPVGRRVVTVADARAVSGSRLRRMAARAVGGVIPVGPRATEGSTSERLYAARSALDTGSLIAIFPEVGRPAHPPQVRRLSAGVAHVSAIASAPVVPVVFGGTDELYLRRRIEIRVLPAVAPPPDVGRPAISAWMDAFRSTVQAAATEAHHLAEAKPPRRKRWLWLTGNYPRA